MSTASAQATVTVYGLIDMGLTHSRSGTTDTRIGLDSGSWYGSRVGFRGTEALGNGLTVNVQLENGFSADTGSLAQGGRFLGRHAWISVGGRFGAVKVGRQLMPAYVLLSEVIDPFEDGMAGAASSFFGRNIFNDIDVRMNNAIAYSVAGGNFTADIAYGMGEVAGNSSANRQRGGALTYQAGSLKAVFGYHDVNNATDNGSARLAFFGGTYAFGEVKLHLGVDQQRNKGAGGAPLRNKDVLIALTIPVEGGNLLGSYNRLTDNTVDGNDSTQYAIAYVRNISKRTSLYSSYGYVNLNDRGRFNIGVRHKF